MVSVVPPDLLTPLRMRFSPFFQTGSMIHSILARRSESTVCVRVENLRIWIKLVMELLKYFRTCDERVAVDGDGNDILIIVMF